MREIKFRVWNSDEMEESTLSFNFEDGQTKKEIHIYPEDVFMQYTGKCDKYDNDIYEDDIVTVLGDTARVIWLNDAWYYQKNNGHLQPLGDFGSTAYVVIGNIYENPELLEQQC